MRCQVQFFSWQHSKLTWEIERRLLFPEWIELIFNPRFVGNKEWLRPTFQPSPSWMLVCSINHMDSRGFTCLWYILIGYNIWVQKYIVWQKTRLGLEVVRYHDLGLTFVSYSDRTISSPKIPFTAESLLIDGVWLVLYLVMMAVYNTDREWKPCQ